MRAEVIHVVTKVFNHFTQLLLSHAYDFDSQARTGLSCPDVVPSLSP